MSTAPTQPAETEQERDGYTVKEFGALYGKGKDWVYKLLYAGKLKRMPGLGSVIIPASERQRLLKSASFMTSEPQAKPKKGK